MSDSAAFIHSALDDYGLTAAEFRVVCRVARRGNCTESIPKIAKGCRLHEKTVKAALKFVVARRILSREDKPGATSCHKVNPIELWLPPIGGAKIIPHPPLGGSKPIPHPPPKEIPHTGANQIPQGGSKVIPPKVIPLSTSPEGNPNKGEGTPRSSASLGKEAKAQKLALILKDINRVKAEIKEEEETYSPTPGKLRALKKNLEDLNAAYIALSGVTVSKPVPPVAETPKVPIDEAGRKRGQDALAECRAKLDEQAEMVNVGGKTMTRAAFDDLHYGAPDL